MLVVEVRDGFVDAVWSDTPGKYILLDWDAEEHAWVGEKWVHMMELFNIEKMPEKSMDAIEENMEV